MPLLRCGNQEDSSMTDIQWCKRGEHLCETVLSKLRGKDTKVYPPWTPHAAQLVDGSSLQLTSVSSHRDNGTFRCTAGSYEAFTDLTVIKPIKDLVLTGPSGAVPESTEVTLICEAEGGEPPPNLTWTVPVRSAGMTNITKGLTSMLTFTTDKTMDNGTFVCVATQHEFRVTRGVTLDVKYGPTVSVTTVPALYSLGDQVTLVCSAQGNPRPSVRWDSYEDTTANVDGSNAGNESPIPRDLTDLPVRQTPSWTGSSVNKDKRVLIPSRRATTSLTIQELTVSDISTFVCSATNSEGTARHRLTLAPKSDFEMNVDKLQPYRIPLIGALVALLGISGAVAGYRLCGSSSTGRVGVNGDRQEPGEDIVMTEARGNILMVPGVLSDEDDVDSYLHPVPVPRMECPYESLRSVQQDDGDPYEVL